ncbi:MAG: thiamine biosynthesis protein ThiJ [Geobacteraceae bacterium GWC2_55_20]|nr:MAG: thiamine biosynthesis protein ThiJ [Geobacteraceae bacterium GWC2_55_20]HBA72836.1 thiamine biosynthesis protein ThiJ [Geobacter sp.]HCE66060.1 thiamine biosynthesis protein ThiJ [Geobacter sp.]
MAKKVLLLATNYGAWAEELQAPWDALKKAGFDVTMATPQGKKPLPFALSVDPDFDDPLQHYKVNPPEVCTRVKEILAGNEWNNPIKIEDARMADYEAIVLTGGPGVCLDITNNPKVHTLLLDAFNSDKLIGAICYSVGALAFTRNPANGFKSIISGKKSTAHPRAWDFDFELSYVLAGTTPDNKGTDVVTPGFLLPLQDVVTDAVAPGGACIADEQANRVNPCVVYDWPFVTALSVESSIAYGQKLVEVLNSK